MSYQYGQDARSRISALGQAKLSDFIDEVPVGIRKAFYDLQSPISGFRKGSEPEFKKQQERLIKRLIQQQTGPKGEADWRTFASFWEGWAICQLKGAFPKDANFPFSPESGAEFLRVLVEHLPDTSRELSEQIFRFSGFDYHPDAMAELDRFYPAKVLTRNKLIDDLPPRLEKLEAGIGAIEKEQHDAVVQVTQLASDLMALSKIAELSASSARDFKGDLERLRVGFDEFSIDLEQLRSTLAAREEASREHSATILNFEQRIEALGRALEAMPENAGKWVESSSAISALRDAVAQQRHRESTWTAVVESVDAIKHQMDSLALEASNQPSPGPARVGARILVTESQETPVEIRSVEDVCAIIANNLQACGVLASLSETLARQIIAGLASGQIVQFRGSLGDLVADSVLSAISGSVFHEWRIPVGLTSDEIAAECLDTIAEGSCGLILKGVNRSAFEVYGTAIRDLVVRRQYSNWEFQQLVLVASWSDGAATFPDGGMIAELGPVFDTDTFSMRSSAAKLPPLKFGQLVSVSWDQLLGELTLPHHLIKELKDRLRPTGFSPGSLWWRVAERALIRLCSVPGATDAQNLHALITLWALPWAKASTGTSNDVDQLAVQVWEEVTRDVEQLEAL
jgi:hypothetical protein